MIVRDFLNLSINALRFFVESSKITTVARRSFMNKLILTRENNVHLGRLRLHKSSLSAHISYTRFYENTFVRTFVKGGKREITSLLSVVNRIFPASYISFTKQTSSLP